jgi:hypothetical protein
MKKYIAPLMMVLLVVYCNAMKTVQKNSLIPCDDICYLNQMPRDILDYIASFLTYDDETEEEFVARIQVKDITKETTEDCNEFLVNYGFSSARIALCPDEAKALFFVSKVELLDNGRKVNVDNIIIFDRQKNNDGDKIIYQQKIDNMDQYDHIALSPSGSMIAALYTEKEYNFGGGERSYYACEIRKVDIQKKQARCIPFMFAPEGIFFNKQGTHLIVHGTKDSSGKKPYHIIPLKIVDSKQPQVIVPITNKLQVYLKNKFVCDRYIEGKK